MAEPLVTIIVLTWNSKEDIDDCLLSMLKQSYSNYKIMVLDSCSSDGTVEHIRINYPVVDIVALETNEGYRRGNVIGMKRAEGEFIVICNDDVEVDHNWLSAMVDEMCKSDVGIVTPLILMHHDRDVVNVAGNILHYSGIYGPRGKGELRQAHVFEKVVAAVSGCCFMIRRDLMLQLSYFSSDFDQFDPGWHASFEDVDLGWRALMAGYKIKYVPESVMYHKYKQPDMFAARFGAYEWGRYLSVVRNYHWLTLLTLTPVSVTLEIMAWIYACVKGAAYLKAKTAVMKWLITHPRDILKMRQAIQQIRVVHDYDIVKHMDSKLSIGRSPGNIMNSLIQFISTIYYYILLFVLKLHKLITYNA